jgi:TolB-like protein
MLLTLAVLLPLAADAEPPSVAVLPLEAKVGVSADVADLLTSHLTNLLRDAGAFSRVVGTREIEAVIGFERQRELMACNSTSCLAQMAGALGVDFIVTGTAGRLGASWLLNVSLVDVRSGQVRASVSRPVTSETEEGLLAVLPGVASQVLQKAGLVAAGQEVAAAARTVVPSPSRPGDGPARTGGGVLGKVVSGAGVAVLATGGLTLVASAVAGLAATGTWMLVFVAPTAFLGLPARGLALAAAYHGSGTVALAALGLAVVLLGAGATTLGAGLLVG